MCRKFFNTWSTLSVLLLNIPRKTRVWLPLPHSRAGPICFKQLCFVEPKTEVHSLDNELTACMNLQQRSSPFALTGCTLSLFSSLRELGKRLGAKNELKRIATWLDRGHLYIYIYKFSAAISYASRFAVTKTHSHRISSLAHDLGGLFTSLLLHQGLPHSRSYSTLTVTHT